jgi:hypothetical protein
MIEQLLLSQLLGGQGGGMNPVQAVAQGAGGLVGLVSGIGQRKKAKELLSRTQRPMYAIPAEILKSQKQAELTAGQGLPSQQYNQAMQNVLRRQNEAIKAATDRRSGMMSIAAANRAANDAGLNIDVADAEQRLRNQNTLHDVSGRTAQFRDKQFQINQMEPYIQNYNYAQSLLGAGNQNLMGGIDRLIGGAAQFLGSNSNS